MPELKKILVTGATGYIAKHLVLQLLEAGHSVRASVRRVVVTGSIASISNRELPDGRPFDEGDWSMPGYPTTTPYALSKLEAERAAWKYVELEAPSLRLTVINPGFVLGTPLDRNYGSSLSVIERFMKGRDPMLPDVGLVSVDVRDIARMHVLALETPASAGKRILGAAEFLTFRDMAMALKQRFPERRIPTRVAPHFVIRMLGLFDKSIAAIIPSLGRREVASRELAQSLFGIEFRDPLVSVAESAEFMVENGIA